VKPVARYFHRAHLPLRTQRTRRLSIDRHLQASPFFITATAPAGCRSMKSSKSLVDVFAWWTTSG
jgi:hypothetical protein